MVQQDYPQSNPGAIEALKAATYQVGHQSAPNYKNPGSPTVTSPIVHMSRGEPTVRKPQPVPASENFAEAFIGKITAIEQEKVGIEKEQLAVDQELDRVLKLQSGLTEKKQQLEQRRNEFIAAKDKLTALDKELSSLLKLPSL